MTDNRNMILAVILSGIVLLAWQYFYYGPQTERQRAQQQAQAELQKSAPKPADATSPSSAPPQPGSTAPAPAAPTAAAAPVVSRDAALAESPRVKIETASVTGSISLKGARIDDLSLVKFRDTVDPASPAIVLYSPSGTAAPYYAEFGWVPAAGSTARVPDRNTQWQQENSGALTPTSPVVLKYDNGEGLTFRRTISVDDRYLFTIKDDVSNVGICRKLESRFSSGIQQGSQADAGDTHDPLCAPSGARMHKYYLGRTLKSRQCIFNS